MKTRLGMVLLVAVLSSLWAACQAAPPAPAATATAAVTPLPAPTEVATEPATAAPTNSPPPSPSAAPLPTLAGPTAASRSATSTAPANDSAGVPVTGSGIVVDRHSVALFEQIPPEYLEAARNLPMIWADRSVGKNIDESLDCLTAPSWAESRAYCRQDYTSQTGSTWPVALFMAPDEAAGRVPERIRFTPDPSLYDRSNWLFVEQGGEWQELIQSFTQQIVPQYVEQAEVLSFQVTYLNVQAGSDIASADQGFFVDLPRTGTYRNRERWDISDLQEIEAAYPDKVFIYWTTSLARAIGTAESDAFNDQMRAYAIANGKPLFDVADILAHDLNGNACYDNRDAVEFCGSNGCENHADDGQAHLAMCPDYTTELEGGHLGAVSGARIQIAKAFWVLMAQIAGWEP